MFSTTVGEEKETFKGEVHWDADHLQQCAVPRNNNYKQADLACYTYFMKDFFDNVRMELISRDPIIIVFRKLADENSVTSFLKDVHQQKLRERKVLNKETGLTEVSKFRQSNGTSFFHRGTPAVATVFKRVETVLPHVNFKVSEHWGINVYNPGGHYAVHSDYLVFPNEESWDPHTRLYGNRWATFLLILKTADMGGGTVFPNIKTTVLPEAGDAIFWTNMNTDGTFNSNANHGACPIIKGQKIAATLWIRENFQPLLISAEGEALFDPSPFLQPSSYTAQCSV